MSFESGGQAQDPFSDELEEEQTEEADETQEADAPAEVDDSTDSPDVPEDDDTDTVRDTETGSVSETDSRDILDEELSIGERIDDEPAEAVEDDPTEPAVDDEPAEPAGNAGDMPPYLTDIDVRDQMSLDEMAQSLTVPEYRKEAPANIPYATWRDGTSTGRGRLTIEINKDIDLLVNQVKREFKNEYDADIHKADIREFALLYGLMHKEELFEMAEVWGLQYS